PAGERAGAAGVRAVSAQPDAHAVPRSELSAGDERLRALGTWAVVGGTLRRRGRRYRLQFTLRAVGDDAVRSDLTLRARGLAGLRRAVLREVPDWLAEGLAACDPALRPPAQPSSDPDPPRASSLVSAVGSDPEPGPPGLTAATLAPVLASVGLAFANRWVSAEGVSARSDRGSQPGLA